MKNAARKLFPYLVIGIVLLGCDSQPILSLRHRIQVSLKPYAAVTTIDIDGVGPIRMFLNPDDAVITPYMTAGRVWEATETHWFVKSLRPGDVVVDVGANVGYYTIIAGKLVGETGRVYAFEPDPVSFELLRRNVRLNGLDNVFLEQKAVSNEKGTLELFIAEENKGDHRIYQPEGEQRESVTVEAVSLDDYFKGSDETVDFVKVDTQGAEVLILQGMEQLLRRSNEIVMAFEYSPRHVSGLGFTGGDLLDAIDSHQLKMFDLGMGGPEVRRIQAVKRQNLEKRFSATSRWFTNLLLVTGRQDLIDEIAAQPLP